MPISFSMEDILAIQKGDVSEELQNRIHEGEKYEKSAGLRAKVKSTANDNAAKFITDNLAKLDIPAGVKDINLLYDYSVEAGHFIVRKNGVRYTMGNDVLAAPSLDTMSIVSKAFALKKSKENDNIINFITEALGGQKVVDHVLTTHKFEKETKPVLEEIYTITNAEPLGAGIAEIPEGDKLKVTLQYSKVAADKDPAWTVICSCGKNVSSGGGDGTRRKKTPAPEGHKTWRAFVENDTAPETVAVLASVIKKHGADWTKHISPTGALRQAKHPVITAADLANPARL